MAFWKQTDNTNNIYYENNNGSVSINTQTTKEITTFSPNPTFPYQNSDDAENEGSNYGYSLALSEDNNNFFLSAPGDGDQVKGYIQLYTKNEDGEWDKSVVISPPDSAAEDYFGTSLSISLNYLAVASPSNKTIYIYTKN